MISFGGSPALSFLWRILDLVVVVALGATSTGILYVVNRRGVSSPFGNFEAGGEVFVILSKLNAGDPLKGFEVSGLSGFDFVPDGLSSGVDD